MRRRPWLALPMIAEPLSNSTPTSIGPFTVPKLPCDSVKQFTHVAMLGVAPLTIDLISGQIPVGIDVITAFVTKQVADLKP